MEVTTVDLSKNLEVRKVWTELGKRFIEEVFRLYEIEEEKEREARARIPQDFHIDSNRGRMAERFKAPDR